MPPAKIPMSKRHPLGPRVQVQVTAELINTSVRNNSSHCMIAEAIKVAVPQAKNVAVDISTSRFTDRDKGLRYVYLTPRVAQEALVDFDEGAIPKPFNFLLRNAHVSRAGKSGAKDAKAKGKLPTRRKLVSSAGRGENKRGSTLPREIGGRRPPQLHIRREFGLRAFRAASLNRLKAEQPTDFTPEVQEQE